MNMTELNLTGLSIEDLTKVNGGDSAEDAGRVVGEVAGWCVGFVVFGVATCGYLLARKFVNS